VQRYYLLGAEILAAKCPPMASSFCPTTKLLMGESIGSEEELLGEV
jgi:hypothetical protein